MAKVCEICNKGYQRGNLVPRGIGKRVTRRTTVRHLPNLFTKKLNINGINTKVRLCTSCLKRLKFETALIEKAEVEAKA